MRVVRKLRTGCKPRQAELLQYRHGELGIDATDLASAIHFMHLGASPR
jgi:hypothetical protein